MSTATISRQYCIKVYDPEVNRLSEKALVWSYGQAVNAATTHAIQFPERIVFLETRLVITEGWEDVDFEAEEERLRQREEERRLRAAEVDA